MFLTSTTRIKGKNDTFKTDTEIKAPYSIFEITNSLVVNTKCA